MGWRWDRGAALIVLGLLSTMATVACTSTGGLASGDDIDAPNRDDKTTQKDAGGGSSGNNANGPQGSPVDAVCEDGKKACGADETCIDVQSDANNCGRCDHSCLGGKCEMGVCQAIELTSKLNIPQGLALGPDGVYVAVWGSNKIVKVPKSGGPAVDVSTATSRPWGIAVASKAGAVTDIVWGEQNGSSSNIAFCGGAVPCTAPKKTLIGNDVFYVAISSGSAYWSTSSSTTGSIQRCSLGGCGGTPFTSVANQPRARGLVVSGAQLVFGVMSAGGVVRRSTTAGTGMIDLIPNLDNADGLATDGTNLYAAVNGSGIIARCPLTGCAGNQQTTLALATYPHGVATDGTNVYWANGLAQGKGSISWCAAANCSGSGHVLADVQSNPYGIAVDDEAIYWTTASPDGSVMKIAKP